MVFDIILKSQVLRVVNTYIRSDLGDVVSLNNYLENLYYLENILDETHNDNILFIGDFNADPFHGRAWRSIKGFIDRLKLICFDYEMMPTDTFTYISYSDSQCKWLDHFIGKLNNDITVEKFNVLNDLVGSDHLPFVATLHFTNFINTDVTNVDICETDRRYVDWLSLTEDELASVSQRAFSLQGNFSDFPVASCTRDFCNSERCQSELKNIYNLIHTSVSQGSYDYSRNFIKKNKFKVIPGWNRNVKAAHTDARNSYIMWLSSGKFREGPLYENMKEFRSEFKALLNLCRKNESEEILRSIESKLISKNCKEFWKEVKNRKGRPSPSDIIDNLSVKTDIVELFSNKFISNDDNGDDMKDSFMDEFISIQSHDRKAYLLLSSMTIRKLIMRLNSGSGYDQVHSRLLNFACTDFIENLVIFINACFNHNFLPLELLKGEINPIIKDKNGKSSDSSNYRPIMQSSSILKIIELHVLDYLSEKLKMNSR